MSEISLPAAFAELEDFADVWAQPTENGRSEIRWKSSAAEFRVFYEAAMPRLSEILDLLSARLPHEIDPAHRRLYYLACALGESTPHHELYRGSATVPFSFDARRFVPSHGSKDSIVDLRLR